VAETQEILQMHPSLPAEPKQEDWWHRVRSVNSLLLMLWVGLGFAGAIYATIAISHPGFGEGLLIPPTVQWPGEPQVLTDVAPVAEVIWGLLTFAVLITGIFHLRRWHRGRWLRVCGWTACWLSGYTLMSLAVERLTAGLGENGTNLALVSSELVIAISWLLLGVAMTVLSAKPRRVGSTLDGGSDTETQ